MQNADEEIKRLYRVALDLTIEATGAAYHGDKVKSFKHIEQIKDLKKQYYDTLDSEYKERAKVARFGYVLDELGKVLKLLHHGGEKSFKHHIEMILTEVRTEVGAKDMERLRRFITLVQKDDTLPPLQVRGIEGTNVLCVQIKGKDFLYVSPTLIYGCDRGVVLYNSRYESLESFHHAVKLRTFDKDTVLRELLYHYMNAFDLRRSLAKQVTGALLRNIR